jgi:hypothetical protein
MNLLMIYQTFCLSQGLAKNLLVHFLKIVLHYKEINK